jgi:hypothetical protein
MIDSLQSHISSSFTVQCDKLLIVMSKLVSDIENRLGIAQLYKLTLCSEDLLVGSRGQRTSFCIFVAGVSRFALGLTPGLGLLPGRVAWKVSTTTAGRPPCYRDRCSLCVYRRSFGAVPELSVGGSSGRRLDWQSRSRALGWQL